MGLAMEPQNFQVHPRQLLTAGIRVVAGVRLNNLNDLLAAEIPQLRTVKPLVGAPPRHVSGAPRLNGQNEVNPLLPGDQGRVWAKLGSNPIVGIYQTHSHESFWPYVPSGPAAPYSTDWSKTIVQVGWWLSEDLHKEGVSVVQSRVDNMSEGLLASYSKSFYTAKQLMSWYPSVRMLIDLHRSADDVAPAVIQGAQVSKILIVVGTSQLLPNPFWRQNLRIAQELSKALKKVAPGISLGKGIDMVPYRYNQQLMPADLMIEVGGPNSTLAEERLAVDDLAKALNNIILDGMTTRSN